MPPIAGPPDGAPTIRLTKPVVQLHMGRGVEGLAPGPIKASKPGRNIINNILASEWWMSDNVAQRGPGALSWG